MTQHEQHMEIYMETILGTVQTLCKAVLCAFGNKDIITRSALTDLSEALRTLEENAISVPSCRVQGSLNQSTANKYLKLYQDSEDMCAKCVKVLTIMCAHKVPEDADSNIIEAWSVIKCASGRILVTVDYWGNDGDMYTYQFPVAWLDLPKKQLEEQKAGCQLV